MKRFSQTLKVSLALFVAVFSNGTLSTVVAAATPPEEADTAITEVVLPEEESIETTDTSAESEVIAPLAFSFVEADSQPMTFGNSYSPPHNDTPVTPVKPSIKDVCGTSGDQYTIPTVDGVEYWRGNTKLTNGQTYSTNGSTSITITAKVKKNSVESWKLEFDDTCTICHRTASASNPYVKLVVDEHEIDGGRHGNRHSNHQGPLFPATGVDGKWGDIIPATAGYSGLNWTAEGRAIIDNNCNVPVTIAPTPGPCAYYDTKSWVTINLSGTAKNTTLVVKDSVGKVVKTWDIQTNNNGDVTSPSLPVTLNNLSAGSYTVELVSKKDGVVASSSFTIEQCYYAAYPEEPNLLDLCYGDKDKIYIEQTKGVIYTVNNTVATGWINYEGEALVVNATAATGYQLDAETPSSWTFDSSDFTDEQCLTIAKTGKVASDVNHDGVIGIGDTVSWEITVTNTSQNDYESFYVTVDDTGVTLQNNGYISYLGAGKHVTLSATSTLTAQDFQACKAVNTATFSGWRAAHKTRGHEQSLRMTDEERSNPLATGSATAEYTLTCPTPGSGSGSSSGSSNDSTTTVTTTAATTTPTTIPETGANPTGNPLLTLAAAALAYGATFFLQQRRSHYATTHNK